MGLNTIRTIFNKMLVEMRIFCFMEFSLKSPRLSVIDHKTKKTNLENKDKTSFRKNYKTN